MTKEKEKEKKASATEDLREAAIKSLAAKIPRPGPYPELMIEREIKELQRRK